MRTRPPALLVSMRGSSSSPRQLALGCSWMGAAVRARARPPLERTMSDRQPSQGRAAAAIGLRTRRARRSYATSTGQWSGSGATPSSPAASRPARCLRRDAIGADAEAHEEPPGQRADDRVRAKQSCVVGARGPLLRRPKRSRSAGRREDKSACGAGRTRERVAAAAERSGRFVRPSPCAAPAAAQDLTAGAGRAPLWPR